MPTAIEDLIILLDAQLLDAPVEIRDDWRRVRGHLRQRGRRPSSVSMNAVPDTDDVPTGKHFKTATEILQNAKEPKSGT